MMRRGFALLTALIDGAHASAVHALQMPVPCIAGFERFDDALPNSSPPADADEYFLSRPSLNLARTTTRDNAEPIFYTDPDSRPAFAMHVFTFGYRGGTRPERMALR